MRTLETLKAPPVIQMLAELNWGLVLVTGATGSGKSTTLAAMVHHINATSSKHIITIEDPVEAIHVSDKSLINQREVGRDTASFADTLRSALREDPDVILVGEMRDHETISLALTAAEAGQLVLSTLHTNSAVKTVTRIIDVFPSGDKEMVMAMLAGTLEGVIAQVLLNSADGSGKEIGYEILIGTMAVRNLIRDEKVQMIYSMMQTGARFGMQTMQDAIEDLIAADRITQEEAERAMMIMGGAESAGDPQDAPPPPTQKPGDGEEAAPQRRSVARKLTKKEETGRYSF
jgi:twitching motility protein PilT